MANVFTYYLYLPSFGQRQVYDVNLNFVLRRNERFYGIIDYLLEGSIILLGNDFDAALTAFTSNGYIPGKIYKNGVNYFDFQVWDFCDLNYIEKKGTLKNFLVTEYMANNSIRNYGIKNIVFPGVGTTPIYANIGEKMTDYGYSLINLLSETFTDERYSGLLILEDFDTEDMWFNDPIILPEFENLRLTPMGLCKGSDGIHIIGGQVKNISVNRLFEVLCDMFNITICIENLKVKFKRPEDFIQNSLDLSTYLSRSKTRNYDLTKLIQFEELDFSDNNNIGNDVDFVDCLLEYANSGKKLTHNLKDITTQWTFSENISNDGYFISDVSTVDGTEYLRAAVGINSASSQLNGNLCPGNLLANYYKDWVYSDKGFFRICGNLPTNPPTYFKEFIEVQNIIVTLDDPATLIDSVILETVDGANRYGIVTEQKTNLKNNQTSLKCYEFKNEIV